MLGLTTLCGPVASDRFAPPHPAVERIATHWSADRSAGDVEFPRLARLQEASDMQVEQFEMRRPDLGVLRLAAQLEFLFGPSAMIMPIVLVNHLGLPHIMYA